MSKSRPLGLASSTPVDRTARRVLSGGEHFEARFDDARPKFKATMEAPPAPPEPRPESAVDHAGKRVGRMTALYWYKPTHSGKSSVWVVRCDCGRFEFRSHLLKWEKKANDMCEVCTRELEMQAGPNSKERRLERVQKFLAKLVRLGLTEAEAVAFIESDHGYEEGDTAESIRARLLDAGESQP